MIIEVLPPEIQQQFERIAKKNQLSVNTLFQRNTELSQITWEILRVFELNLRWHVDQIMISFTQNPSWRQDGEMFIPKHLSRSSKVPKNYQVISLGFICLLFSDRYHTKLWVPCFRSSLPSWVRTRRELHASLTDLVQVRNRIAHHEIIYNYPLIEIIDFAQQILVDINEFAAEEIRKKNYASIINNLRLGSGGGI